MLGPSVAFYTSLLTTTVAVAMATIFFCCFGKRNSVDAGETSGKAGNGANSSQPEAHKGSKTSVNGRPGENGSAANSPVQIVVDSSDLGDFSAVSRETEILRSYRKPPPPKNRARQSRAPRALLKSSTENLDIFTELSEETNSTSLELPTSDLTAASETPRPASEGGSDSSPLLRPRRLDDVVDGGAPKREDVRSSMLADIEQTLAALHLKDEKDTQGGEKDTQDDNKDIKEGVKDTKEGDKDTKEGDKDTKGDTCVQAKVVSVSSRPNSHLAEGTEEQDKSPAKPSLGGQSPLLKAKVGPPVSPKPNIRKKILTTQRASDEDTDSKEISKADAGEKISTSKTDSAVVESATSAEVGTADIPADSSTQGEGSSNGELSPDAGGPESKQESSLGETSSDSHQPPEKQESSQDETHRDSHQSPEQPVNPASPVENEKSEKQGEVSATDTPSADDTTASQADDAQPKQADADKAASRPSSSYDNIGETESDKGLAGSQDAGGTAEQPLPPTSGEDAAADTTDPSSAGASEKPGSPEEESPKPADPDGSPEKAGGESSEDPPTPTEEAQKGGTRQDSTEEQAGKGKTSRIPVRAGSKPRSSPADAEKQEETSSN